MRMGELTYSVVFYGLLIGGVIALLVFIGMLEGNRDRRVPIADAVNPAVGADEAVARAQPMVRILVAGGVLLAAIVGAFWIHHNRIDVIVIADDGAGGARATRFVQLSVPDGMPLAHPSKVDDMFVTDQVWVINQSQHTAKLEDLSYGIGLGFGNDAKLVPPGTMEHTRSIDYVGPDDVPPKEVTVTTGLNFDIRTWLTWDR